jgi:hypothetical protein
MDRATSRGKIARRIARGWTALVIFMVLLILLTPGEEGSGFGQPPLSDMIELGLLGLAICGLLLAFFREGLGGALAITGVIGHNLVFRIIRGYWFVEMGPAILLYLVFLVPSGLYLYSWHLSRSQLIQPVLPDPARRSPV